jgi:hypothetical protein
MPGFDLPGSAVTSRMSRKRSARTFKRVCPGEADSGDRALGLGLRVAAIRDDVSEGLTGVEFGK